MRQIHARDKADGSPLIGCKLAEDLQEVADARILFGRAAAQYVGMKRGDQQRHDLEGALFVRQRRLQLRYVFQIDDLKFQRVLRAVKNLIGEQVAFVGGLQAAHDLFVGLHVSQRRGEILQSRDKRTFAAAVRRAQEDVKVRAGAFGEFFVGPGVRGAAPVKVDVRRDHGLRPGPAVVLRQSGAVGRFEVAP